MKIWKSFSSEQSAKLRITGTFKTVKDAEEASKAFNELLSVESEIGEIKNYPYPKELTEVIEKYKLHLPPKARDDFNYIYPINADENKIVVETDDFAINALSEIFIRFGGKIEIYSKHDYNF